MKTHRVRPLSYPGKASLTPFTRLAALLALIGIVGISLFSSSSASSIRATLSRESKNRSLPLMFPYLGMMQETIETFASDCTTPKAAFVLGETVCAKTDGVDLNFPGGRWVHWLRQDLSIAFGGSGVTDITTNPQTFTFVPDTTGTWKVTIAETGDISQTPAVFTVSANPAIATYDGATCTSLQDNFSIGDTVCAKANSNFSGSRLILFVDSQGGVVQSNIISSTSPSANFVATTAGNFRVYLSDGDALLARSFFTVSDPGNPTVDLSVLKYNKSGDFTNGNPASYEILVTNNGPDTASSVELTDAVPSGLTYLSSSQDSGPAFTQTTTAPVTTWQIASLAAGASARFTITYTVTATAGTVISNTATVTNTAEETHNDDNTSETFDVVSTGGGAPDCSLDCPNDLVVTATTHGENGGATVNFSTPDAVGSCGTITTTPTSGSFFPIGTTTVTSTSATGNGFCTFKVTVVDSDAPTISCPANITVTANEGEATAFVPNPNGTSSNVGTATVTGDQPLELSESREDGEALTAAYPVGVTEITRVVTDPSGRQATCTQTITVLPNKLLTITCPANVTVPSPTGCDPATGVNVGQATSNSTTATITAQRSDGQALNDPYPVGTTTIEWTATDTDSQVATCTQTVTVTGTDTTPPILHVPANVSVSTSSCSATLDDELGIATAEDPDCNSAVSISRTGIPQVSCPTPQNPNKTCDSFVFPTGVTIITYTATNSSGLSTVGTQTVTVTEDPAIPPTISAPADVTLFTGPGASSCGVTVADLNATLGTATANDNCPGVTVTRSGVPAGNVFPVGNTTVTYTATDRNGNTASDIQVVTVVDNTPPAIECPANITLDPSCPTGAIATWTAPVGTDNCPGATTTRTAGPAPGSVFPIGTTTVTYSVTDAHGNGPVSCSFTVTVKTPQAVIQELIAAVNASSLTGTQKNGLLAKLTDALNAINQGKTNIACPKLSDFVNNVATLVSHGDLSSTVGNLWISRANKVRNTIGCTNLPCS